MACVERKTWLNFAYLKTILKRNTLLTIKFHSITRIHVARVHVTVPREDLPQLHVPHEWFFFPLQHFYHRAVSFVHCVHAEICKCVCKLGGRRKEEFYYNEHAISGVDENFYWPYKTCVQSFMGPWAESVVLRQNCEERRVGLFCFCCGILCRPNIKKF